MLNDDFLKGSYTFILVNICFLFLLTYISLIFVDKSLALWVWGSGYSYGWTLYVTEYSPVFMAMIYVCVLISLTNLRCLQKILMVLILTIICSFALYTKTLLKTILGRNWPDFWLGVWNIKYSPYLNSYGFHFNFYSKWQGSFPSGHTTFIGLLGFIILMLRPSYSFFIYSYMVLLTLCLVMLNHHFLSDCFAGYLLGALFSMLFILSWGWVIKISSYIN